MPAPDGAGMKTVTAIVILTVAVGVALSVTEETAAKVGSVIVDLGGAAAASASDAGTRSESSDPMLMWAESRFDRAGLALPDVEVRHGEDRSDCGGNMAIAIHGSGTPSIVLCVDATASDIVLKRTLLHELAHVWANAELDDATRSAFVEARGLESWADAARWSERGSEHAAEVVTWALMDTELSMLTLEDHDPESLATAYRVLTGQGLPHR